MFIFRTPATVIELRDFFKDRHYSHDCMLEILETIIYTASEPIKDSYYLVTDPAELVESILTLTPHCRILENGDPVTPMERSDLEHLYELAQSIQREVNRLYRRYERYGDIQRGQTFRLVSVDSINTVLDLSYQGAH